MLIDFSDFVSLQSYQAGGEGERDRRVTNSGYTEQTEFNKAACLDLYE